MSVGSAVQTYLFLLRVRRVRKEEVERSAGLRGGGVAGGAGTAGRRRREREGQRRKKQRQVVAGYSPLDPVSKKEDAGCYLRHIHQLL